MFLTRSWRSHLLLLSAMIPLCPMLGCSATNTDRGLVTGGALGALAGGLVGGSRGHGGAGALIGGALGAAAGGLTGAAIDKSEQRVAVQQANQRALALQDIVALTASGSPDDIIISQIRNSGSAYNLRTEEVLYLQNNGVREPVIRYMQATACRPVVPVYAPVQPVYAPVQPVYVVRPPRPCFGVGVRIH